MCIDRSSHHTHNSSEERLSCWYLRDRSIDTLLDQSKFDRDQSFSYQYLREEADALMETLGFDVALSETVRMRKYHPRTYIGKGVLSNLRGTVAALGAATVFINTPFLTVP